MTLDVVDAVTRAVCWTAGMVEGVMSGLVGGRGGRYEAVRGGVEGRFYELRGMLMGKTRRQIVRALGAPPTASVGFGVSVVTGGAPLTFMHAPTWYYPFDADRQQAIAIKFVGDRARGVEFIGGLQEVVAEA
jgi:hypothetical protein